MNKEDLIIDFNDPILVTGANGFIGSRVVETLLSYGYYFEQVYRKYEKGKDFQLISN